MPMTRVGVAASSRRPGPRRWLAGIALSAVAAVGGATLASADDAGISSRQAEEILQELRKIRQLLEKPPAGGQAGNPAPPPAAEVVSLALGDANAIGALDAPVTIVEFTDYQCPFCRRYHTSAFEEIKKAYVDTGKVRYVSRDLPLPMHEHAAQAAHAVRCAAEQGQYWTYRHVLFVNQQKLGDDDMARYAADLRLDVDKFAECVRSDRHRAAVERDASDAAAIGITGTPTFVIGRTHSDGRLTGVKVIGAQAYPAFEARIKEQLDAK
jgi:protein-disulfide isomerase